ncbi:TerD family protein [Nocardioides zeae]|uniref:TerD family protein n=1 Tax=Nocardioides zeae TaxID=1457234 RepID=A0A6P0HNZ1_9ACTN|nr:TerD family protein [Nocardioides zeae]NEN80361.1 TerD family protein [Nocardioides zeae]
MTTLVAGQNVPWPHPACRVVAPGVALAVLPLGADGRVVDPAHVVHAAGEVHLGLADVPAECDRLLVVGLDPGPARLDLLDGAGAPVLGVDVRPDPAASRPRVVALVEVYRRAGAWKVRAVARTYAAGAADVERHHGVPTGVLVGSAPVGSAPVAPVPAAPVPAAPVPAASSPGEVDPERAVQLVGMVLQDAARSAASYESSVAFADGQLERDLDALVADPALRASAAGEAARSRAQVRRDDLVRRAREAHLRDLAALRREVADIERALPPAIARWDVAPAAPTAPTPPAPPPAVRAGDITLPHLLDVPGADFRLPMICGVPGRPLLVTTDEGGDAAATAVARTLALRAVLSLLPHRPRLVVVDLGGTRGDVGLPPGVGGPAVIGASGLTRLLADLVQRAELVAVADRERMLDALDPELARPVVVLLLDVPTLWESEAVPLLDTLVAGPGYGVQLVLTGPGEVPRVGSDAERRLLARAWDASLRLPSGVGGHLADTFAGVSWTFLPDTGPPDPLALTRLLGAHAPLDGWRDGIVPRG